MITLNIFDQLEDDDFDFEIIEDTTTRTITSYNREVECDAVSMDLNNREEW